MFTSYLPGTATKNLTASLCPWNDNCAWAIEQYGIKLDPWLGLLASEYTLTTEPGARPEKSDVVRWVLPKLNYSLDINKYKVVQN